ncbi:hypothetical protein CR152_25790 [Massilia violaceinigra]|uniref:Uncharacterized protein n=1 Tax=Massilia violaceinigra TaxID=2045208 RepID=A0A2D2DRC1_9BURK|nr:hypothetical protein CR152_25790 [Massilia violaceinigra]
MVELLDVLLQTRGTGHPAVFGRARVDAGQPHAVADRLPIIGLKGWRLPLLPFECKLARRELRHGGG